MIPEPRCRTVDPSFEQCRGEYLPSLEHIPSWSDTRAKPNESPSHAEPSFEPSPESWRIQYQSIFPILFWLICWLRWASQRSDTLPDLPPPPPLLKTFLHYVRVCMNFRVIQYVTFFSSLDDRIYSAEKRFKRKQIIWVSFFAFN